MGVSIMALNSYGRLFASPVKNMVNPTANLIYGGAVSSMYVKKLSDSLKSEMSSFLSSLNGSVYELKSSSQSLMESSKDSVLNSKTAASDNPAVSVTAGKGASNETYSISVNQLAQSQKNKGSTLDSYKKTSMNAGTNTFKISTGGKESKISFDVKFTDSNKTALNNMADAINRSGLGITANVITDENKDTSYIEITGNETGSEKWFTISDVSGNAAAKSGVLAATREAKDAEYEINGEKFTSQSNTISLDNGKISITLNAVTQEKATVTVKDDKDAILKAVESFSSRFNQVISFVNSADQFVVSNKLREELKSAISSKAGYLESVGINVKYDGSLELDQKKLTKALDEDVQKIKKLFASPDGLASKVKNITDRTLTSTALDSTGGRLYKNDFTSFYDYLKLANKNLQQRNEAGGLFIDKLL